MNTRLQELQDKIKKGEKYIADLGEQRAKIAREQRKAQGALSLIINEEQELRRAIAKEEGRDEQVLGA